jgi:predicted RNA binding protein YcfA (HicA-like mRNA interferase family)
MMKFPHDAPKQKVLRTLESLGFSVVRTGNHISLARKNADGTITPMTIPNHPHIKASTLRSICTQAGILREEFLKRYEMV